MEVTRTLGNIKYQKEKHAKLRKLLSTAALSAALISWYTTANGLNKYVFSHLWQAYVISAALQGALFTLSIKGIEIIMQLKGVWKKGAFCVPWILLLASSSIFRYIYISGDVYPDTLLREDAQRILSTYCLEENYELSAHADDLLSGNEGGQGIEADMLDYVKVLAITENGVSFSESDRVQLEAVRKMLLSYAYTYPEADAETYIYGCVDTTILVNNIDVILTGKYTDNDITTIETEINNVTKSITRKKYLNQETVAKRQELLSEYQTRLNGFRETVSDAYKDLIAKAEDVQDEISALEQQHNKLNLEQEQIDKIYTVIIDINGSMEYALYNQVLELRSQMNAEDINTKNCREHI